MKNIFRFLAKHKLAILAAICCLVVQAYCDLALPTYTSDVLNVGLQQGGIADGVMDTVRADSLETLELFMTDADAQTVEQAYTQPNASGVRTLRDAADRETLNNILRKPEATVYQMRSSDKTKGAPKQIKAAVAAGAMTKEQLISQMDEAFSKMGDMTDTFLTEIAVNYVSAEYQAQGIDLNQVRNAYLFAVGGKMLLMAVIMAIAAILVGLIASVTSSKVGRDLRTSIYEKVMQFTDAEMEKFSTASLITRSTNDIQQIQMVSVMLLRMVLYAPIVAIGGIIMVVKTGSSMGWTIVLAVVVMMACIGTLTGIAMPKFKIMQKLVDRLNLVSREMLTGIMPIRAFSREKHEEQRFDEANQNLFQTQLFTNRTMTFMLPVMMFVMNGISVLIVWVGGHNVDAGTMQVGDLTAFITYSMVIVMGFLMLTMISIMLPRAGVAADRIVEVLDTPISLHDPERTKDALLEQPKGYVTFQDVSFTYPDADEPALSHISFTAEPGKTTAIIGSTGCGKSTIVRLIPRFFDVTQGAVRIDGVDVREMSQHKLRSLMGYVPQKGVLFSGTIESNLKYGGENISDADMQQAADIAQATEFIDSKVDRYNSLISQGGTNVSGGQKQRLSIARAIAKHPKIYLFDDSFSALDYKTDLTLRKELSKQTADATVIIVAQRISTILHADNILVLDEGKIVGSGTHEELLASCETYQEIAKSQLSEAELAGVEKGGRA